MHRLFPSLSALRTLRVAAILCVALFGLSTHSAPATGIKPARTETHASSSKKSAVTTPADTLKEDADLEGVEPEPLGMPPTLDKSKSPSDPAPSPAPANTSNFAVKAVNSVPYPNGAIYTPRGITGTFLGGKYRNLEKPQSLFQWQGELGYFYKPWFSGGFGFKITAGEPSNTAQEVFNRYFILTRFHWAGKRISAYIGPQLGLDNLNILTGPLIKDSLKTVIQAPINNTNASVGLDMGAGWKFSRWVGLTYGAIMEYSLVSKAGVNNKNAVNIHLLPGICVDLTSFSETLKNLVPAMYATVELQGGFLLLEKNRSLYDQAFVTGLSVAF